MWSRCCIAFRDIFDFMTLAMLSDADL